MNQTENKLLDVLYRYGERVIERQQNKQTIEQPAPPKQPAEHQPKVWRVSVEYVSSEQIILF